MADFADIAKKAANFSKQPSDSEFLEFYGLYKQATAGDVTVDKPGVLDLKGKAKWAAWNQHKGLSSEEAKTAYIKVYAKYAPKYT